MHVLIVEDDEIKKKQVINHIMDNHLITEITEASSLQSGVRLLRKNAFDIIILDMTLPNFDPAPDEPGGGTTHSFGGKEFLKQMKRFQIETPTLVITQFETFGKAPNIVNLEDLTQTLSCDFPNNYIGTVYYHASISDWKQNLDTIINKATKSGN